MLNHIVLMGRLTRDPELRYTGSNIPVTSFSVAVDRDTKDADGERQVDFINCVAWRKTGEFVSKYFSKGNMILVSGKLQIRTYDDREGKHRTAAEVVADSVYFGEAKKSISDKLDELENRFPSAFQTGQAAQTRFEETVGRPRFSEMDEADGELPF